MEATLYKYHGAGNDFLIADGRCGEDWLKAIVREDTIVSLCDRRYGIGGDGLMVLLPNPEGSDADFTMLYFNSDGSSGMMCGNGGRCIAAFAKDMGAASDHMRFMAPDGPHDADVLSDEDGVKTIRLKMRDVSDGELHASVSAEPGVSGWFLDTGTRHFVTFVDDVDNVDVETLGKSLRFTPEFAPVGVNVNFVERTSAESIKVRTFEKGVEAETFACGTGIVASAIATALSDGSAALPRECAYAVQAKRDPLAVDFKLLSQPNGAVFAENIYLTGPAVRVAKVIVNL